MDLSFWDERWQTKQIGFHEGKPNDLLAAHAARFTAKGRPCRLLVPLAGKAYDLRYLAELGHDVVGVEFVRSAIDDFFSEWGVSPTPHKLGAHDAFWAKGVTLLHADVFSLSAESLGRFEGIYDRAALVALDPASRARYAEVMTALLPPGGGMLLIAFSYDQSKTNGPPWSVDEATVRALYPQWSIELLAERSLPTSPRLTEAGVSTLQERAYWLVRH